MIPGVQRLMTRRLALVGAVILTAGILFGYDQGVISGALRGIEADFDLKTTMVEVVTSFVTLGALVGALVAGALADRFGRKPAVLVAGVLFIVGALVEAFAPGSAVLVVGRLTVGYAVGVASVDTDARTITAASAPGAGKVMTCDFTGLRLVRLTAPPEWRGQTVDQWGYQVELEEILREAA